MASFSKTCKRMDLGDISARRILISKARAYDGISIGRFEPGVGPSKRAQTRNSLVVATLTEYGMVVILGVGTGMLLPVENHINIHDPNMKIQTAGLIEPCRLIDAIKLLTKI
jgi:hypothetical protein